MLPMRGRASLLIAKYKNRKVIASQISWVPKLEGSNGGNTSECSPPCASVVAWTSPPSADASTAAWATSITGVSVAILVYPLMSWLGGLRRKRQPGANLPAAAPNGRALISDCEQQQQRDQERKKAKSFGHGETENQVTELAAGGRRITQGARQKAAKNFAHADSRTGHADSCNTGTDV